MNNFTIIYKILRELESSIGENVNLEAISPEHFGISENKRNQLLKMLFEEGYIKGIVFREYLDGNKEILNLEKAEITLSGMQYLQENSMMRKAINALKDTRNILG